MRIQVIACAAIYMTGCSAELAQRPASRDPASAAAAEAPFVRPLAYEPDPSPSAVPAAAPAPAAPAAATVYTCPMHHDVRAATPGECPKCGMALVPADARGPR
jgi:hypothetical protein